MAYDMVRWAAGLLLFFLLIAILVLFTKKAGKAVLISAFVSVILVAVSMVVPIENYFYSFNSVQSAFNYRYHESLLTYAECDEGVVCVGQKDAINYVYYSFGKDDTGYKLPKHLVSRTVFRSSEYGIYLFEKFESQTIIMTQVLDSAYNGEAFEPCNNGYYSYTVVEGNVDYTALTCKGEKVKLI
ncbi:MAG: hypothetical protein IKT61_04880 [Clostridia bacterium]|nr:hypothetical protein [Clostridia bacterium]